MNQNVIKQRARELFQQGQYKKARNLYEKLIKRNRNDAEVLYMLGAICGQTGDYHRAVDYLDKTLKLQPNALVAHCARGAALKQLGRFSEAESALRKALAIKPDLVDASLELAGLLLQQEKPEEAKLILRKVSQDQPNCAEAYHGLGEIAHADRQLDDAIRYYEKALSLKPDSAEIHNRLGFAFHQKGRYEKAVHHYQQAVTIKPDFAEAFNNLGSSQLTAGMLNDAMASFELAIKLDPSLDGAVISKASVYEKKGQHQEAYDTIAPLAEKNIRHPGLGIIYTQICRPINRCDEAIAYVEALISSSDILPSFKERMHYALANLLDKLERYDTAFHHFKAANDLRPDTFRPAEHSAYVSAIMQVFSWGFLADAPRSSIDSNLPIFIVGMPRSGTSLTEQILASHRDIHGAGELLEIGDFAMELSTQLDQKLGFPFSYKRVTSHALDRVAKRYLERLRSLHTDARFITDKMPQNFFHLGLISLLFPKAKIIHCMRDPIDTCLSIYFQDFNESHEYANQLENIGYYYLEYRRLMDHWRSVLPSPIMDIQYQDLVTDPEPSVRHLLEFIGVDWDPACLRFYESKRHVSTASYEQVRQKLYTSSLARWKNYEKHIEPLKEILKPLYREDSPQ